MVIDTWPKWHFAIWPFLWFLGSQMANLGPVDFSLGFHLNITVNDGQNKFEVLISINMARIANSQSKIGQDATFSQL